MNKKSVLWLILDSIFLIVFHIVFFVMGGTNHPASVWIAYAFILFSYGMLLTVPLLTKKRTNEAVFRFPLYLVSSTYFLCELVVGTVFIILQQDTYKYSLVVQIVIAGIYGVLLVTNMIANEKSAEEEEISEDEVKYIRNACYELNSLINKTEEKFLKKQLEKAYDIIHSSPAASNEDARVTEKQVMKMLGTIGAAVKAGNVEGAAACAEEIVELAEKRNRQVKRKIK